MARRNLILKVAASQFSDHGYDHVSINDIGYGAGITGPAIYRYFPGKDDILVSIYQHLYQRATDGVAEIRALDLPAADALGRLVELQIDLAIADPEKIRIVDREERQLPAEVAKELHRQRRQNLDFWIAVAVEACPHLSEEDVHVTVHAVLALINSITLRKSARGADEAVRRRLREMALACFFPSHGAV